MMTVVFLGLIVFVGWILIMSSLRNLHKVTYEQQYKKLLDCSVLERPHKWSYNKNDKLECLECGMVAGSYKTDNGDYNG